MDKIEIIEILKSQKKYSSSCRFEEDMIYYTISGNEYKIDIWDTYGDLIFYFNYSKYSVKEVQITIKKSKATRTKVLSKFREIVRSINTLDFFLKKREEHVSKILPIIISYIKEQFFLEEVIFDSNNNIFRMNFPKTSVKRRRRYRTSSFDPTVEKIENKLIFEPYVNLKDGGFSINLYFTFREDTGKLILTSTDENYRGSGKDITKIIRSEKLKRIMFSEDAN